MGRSAMLEVDVPSVESLRAIPRDEGKRRFVDHLALCEGCTRYLHQFRQTIRALGDLPVEQLPPEARDTLLAAFRDPRG